MVSIHDKAVIKVNVVQATIIAHIKKVEQCCRLYSHIKAHLKSVTDQIAFTSVKVQDDIDLELVTDFQEVNQCLMQQNNVYFSQAHSIPFITSPLSSSFNLTAHSAFGNRLSYTLFFIQAWMEIVN